MRFNALMGLKNINRIFFLLKFKVKIEANRPSSDVHISVPNRHFIIKLKQVVSFLKTSTCIAASYHIWAPSSEFVSSSIPS